MNKRRKVWDWKCASKRYFKIRKWNALVMPSELWLIVLKYFPKWKDVLSICLSIPGLYDAIFNTNLLNFDIFEFEACFSHDNHGDFLEDVSYLDLLMKPGTEKLRNKVKRIKCPFGFCGREHWSEPKYSLREVFPNVTVVRMRCVSPIYARCNNWCKSSKIIDEVYDVIDGYQYVCKGCKKDYKEEVIKYLV